MKKKISESSDNSETGQLSKVIEEGENWIKEKKASASTLDILRHFEVLQNFLAKFE